jgi:hypothetical protein
MQTAVAVVVAVGLDDDDVIGARCGVTIISQGKSEMDMRVGLKVAFPLSEMTASVGSILGGRTMEAELSTRFSASRLGGVGLASCVESWCSMTSELSDRIECIDDRLPPEEEARSFPLLLCWSLLVLSTLMRVEAAGGMRGCGEAFSG